MTAWHCPVTGISLHCESSLVMAQSKRGGKAHNWHRQWKKTPSLSGTSSGKYCISRVEKKSRPDPLENKSQRVRLCLNIYLSVKVPQQSQRCPEVMEESEAEGAIQTWQH